MNNNENISVDQLRFNFKHALKALREGRTLTLTYRREPLAIIQPYTQLGKEISSNDPFYHLDDLAESMGQLNAKDIDQELYGK